MFLLVFRLIGDYVIGCMYASCWLAIELVLGGPLVGLYPEDFSQFVNSQTVREWAESFGLDSVCSDSEHVKICEIITMKENKFNRKELVLLCSHTDP